MDLVDAMGHLVNFALQPGNAAERVALPALVGSVATQERWRAKLTLRASPVTS